MQYVSPMVTKLQNAVLAVDGGGSSSRMAVESAGRTIVVEAGPANVSTDVKAAARTLDEALDRLAARASVPREALVCLPAYLGLAGVVGPEDAEAIRALLPFHGARIEDDRHAAVEGALGPVKDGALAHCGTGSFFGHRADGDTRLAGGWGHRLGDEGSATWLARCALNAALAAHDGLLPPSGLTQRLTRQFGSARGIVGFSLEARPAEWGALAPAITEAAGERDPVARRIMKDGAARIAATLKAMGWRPGERLCLTGSVGPHYAHYLPAAFRDAVSDPEGTPIDGALALARAGLGGDRP